MNNDQFELAIQALVLVGIVMGLALLGGIAAALWKFVLGW